MSKSEPCEDLKGEHSRWRKEQSIVTGEGNNLFLLGVIARSGQEGGKGSRWSYLCVQMWGDEPVRCPCCRLPWLPCEDCTAGETKGHREPSQGKAKRVRETHLPHLHP